MRKSLAPLALLAFATAAGAQTVLTPAAQSGYYHCDSTRVAEIQTYLQPALQTQDTYYDAQQGLNPIHEEYTRGWMAEFRLPTLPTGMTLASATLSATASGSSQRLSVDVYSGDGVVTLSDWRGRDYGFRANAAAGLFSLNVSQSVRSLYASGASYAGLCFACYDRTRVDGNAINRDIMAWSDPKLTLTYAPQAVPEPAAFLPLGLGALALRRRRKA